MFFNKLDFLYHKSISCSSLKEAKEAWLNTTPDHKLKPVLEGKSTIKNIIGWPHKIGIQTVDYIFKNIYVLKIYMLPQIIQKEINQEQWQSKW